MAISSMSLEATDARRTFFKQIFGINEGYVLIAFLAEGKMDQRFFHYPDHLDDILQIITERLSQGNAYYCPQLFRKPSGTKDDVLTCPNAWADLDTCTPEQLQLEPTVVVQSSPGRFQALWCFEDTQDPLVAEDVSRRIAYYHKPHGADTSGWDLTQLLRIPYTPNYKYGNQYDAPLVQITGATRTKYRLDDFDIYPEVKHVDSLTVPMPQADQLPQESPEEIMRVHRLQLDPHAQILWAAEPEGDWSKPLWNLQMTLFEGGLTREEVFVVVRDARCNKYKRDKRPDDYLWREILRSHAKHLENISIMINLQEEQEDLLNEEEYASVADEETFVERYIRWASGLGDAAEQYHQAGGFIILSSLLSGTVRLPTSFGELKLNLWFMLLADTTLTRKSTAMDIATGLLEDVDQDMILATDGSIEGLMQALSSRPGKPSIFLRDEFTGLLQQMAQKDYYAGMEETFTKLYDGKMMKRVLRKETIEVHDPCLILFAGGIKNRAQSLLTVEHVSSGFIPRFLFITAESDVRRVQPLGPPTTHDTTERDKLLYEMRQMSKWYTQITEITLPTGVVAPGRRQWKAELTPEAWERYNYLEKMLMDAAMGTEQPDIMTPAYDRLCKSTLKAATLIAASRQKRETVTVELSDILHAIKFAQQWREYANEIINGVGRTASERDLEKIFANIQKNPGISRSKLMQRYHLKARQADDIFNTLEQRGLVSGNRVGKTIIYNSVPTGGIA